MFSTLRAAVIIGAIFYLSPVRQGGDRPVRLDDVVKWSREAAPAAVAAPLDQAAQLQSLWQALPDSAKPALTNRSAGASAPHAAPPARDAAATDTLLPDDLQPQWRGEPRKRP